MSGGQRGMGAMGVKGVLTAVLFAALAAHCSAAVGTLPYSEDGIDCIDQAILDERIDTSPMSTEDKDIAKDRCRIACQRVKETVVSKGEECAKTVMYMVEILDMVTTGTYDHAAAEEKLHFLIHDHGEESESCFDDIEIHWNAREKTCTPPQSDELYSETTNAATRMSAIRRFAVTFMRRKHHDDFCMGAMAKIMSDPAATAFQSEANGGKCPSVLTQKWGASSCTTECWAQIEAASAVAGGPKCCLATFYSDMYDFTYRPGHFDRENSVQLPSSDIGNLLGSGCSADNLPCTYVYDAIKICGKEEYSPTECGHSAASTLTASPLIALLGAAVAVAAHLSA